MRLCLGIRINRETFRFLSNSIFLGPPAASKRRRPLRPTGWSPLTRRVYLWAIAMVMVATHAWAIQGGPKPTSGMDYVPPDTINVGVDIDVDNLNSAGAPDAVVPYQGTANCRIYLKEPLPSKDQDVTLVDVDGVPRLSLSQTEFTLSCRPVPDNNDPNQRIGEPVSFTVTGCNKSMNLGDAHLEVLRKDKGGRFTRKVGDVIEATVIWLGQGTMKLKVDEPYSNQPPILIDESGLPLEVPVIRCTTPNQDAVGMAASVQIFPKGVQTGWLKHFYINILQNADLMNFLVVWGGPKVVKWKLGKHRMATRANRTSSKILVGPMVDCAWNGHPTAPDPAFYNDVGTKLSASPNVASATDAPSVTRPKWVFHAVIYQGEPIGTVRYLDPVFQYGFLFRDWAVTYDDKVPPGSRQLLAEAHWTCKMENNIVTTSGSQSPPPDAPVTSGTYANYALNQQLSWTQGLSGNWVYFRR